METYIAALDQGTTTSRAILFNSRGEIVSKAQYPFRQIFPQPGWVEHDPMEIWATTVRALSEAVDAAHIDPKAIAGVGITNQRETAILWDRRTGQPVYNAIVWQCRRTAEICDRLKADGLGETVTEKTGLLIDAYFSGTKLKWIMDHVPGVRQRAERGELCAGTVDSWLIWNLTGGKAHVTDYSNASRTMLFNIHTLQWDPALCAALDIPMELLPEPKAFLQELNALGIPGVVTTAVRTEKCGICGTQLSVTVNGAEEESEDVALAHTHACSHVHEHEHEHAHEHSHSHTGIADIRVRIAALPVPQRVRDNILAVYGRLAAAESEAHGRPVDQIHFHEVGTMDALADITAVCLLLERLAPEQIIVSPVHVGSGHVRCAHGILPVPAPATAILLRGVPIYGGHIAGELCTPTGAALLTQFAARFGDMPPMRVERIGYGMGRKDFPAANCVRALLGETEDSAEDVLELACNLDDMTPEAIGFALERLLEAGALDAWTTPIGMKKSRPGVLLRALCLPEKRQAVLDVFLRDTTTLGVREHRCSRTALQRSVSEADSPWGPVRCKQAGGYGVSRKKYEFDDLARIARETGLSLPELLEKLP